MNCIFYKMLQKKLVINLNILAISILFCGYIINCFGSHTCLKTIFGSGYQLKFHYSHDKVNMDRYIRTNIKSMTH